MGKEHEKNIVKVINEQEYLNCILFVINGAQNRIGPWTKYAMAVITSLIPRDMLNNVVVVYTFVDAKETCKFPEEQLEESFEVLPRRFHLDNPHGMFQAKERIGGEGACCRAVAEV